MSRWEAASVIFFEIYVRITSVNQVTEEVCSVGFVVYSLDTDLVNSVESTENHALENSFRVSRVRWDV